MKKHWLLRVQDTLHSIRFRLALWFAVVLALVLLVFSAMVYFSQVQAARAQATARVDSRLRDIGDTFRRSLRDHEEGNWLSVPGTSSGSQFMIQPGEAMILTDPRGNPLGSFGEQTQPDAKQIADVTLDNLDPTRKSSSTIIYHVITGQQVKGGGQTYLFRISPVLFGSQLVGWVILGQPVDPEGQLPRLLLTLVIAGLGTLLVAMAGGYWLADRTLRPVKVITRTAQEIGETDLSRRLNIHNRDELGELAGTFDAMLDRLQAAFNRQRQFTADASHELRTPLTIVELETDRALTAPRSTEEYRRSLRVIRSENSFMSRLVGELLTLARLDSGQANLKCEPLDLSDVALEVVERYSALAARKNIHLEAGDLPEVPLTGDRQYLAQMIGNLVDNAVKYSPPGPGRWVRVETTAGGSPQHPLACVRVSDNGQGIPAEDLPRLFDRFYRVDQARSHNPEEANAAENSDGDIPGSGLGLSIVQWIAQLHGGQVSVESAPGQGATFEIEMAGCAASPR